MHTLVLLKVFILSKNLFRTLKKGHKFDLCPFFFCFLFLSSCATQDYFLKQAQSQAKSADFREVIISTNTFALLSFQKIKNPGQPVNVYFEGDGRAWATNYSVSLDPTPENPVAWKLALLDPSPNVVYMARACQYLMTKECNYSYWTIGRYAPEVVEATMQALNTMRAPMNLIGFSGGAYLGLLMAERRKDILSLRTVAPNLDIDLFTHFHQVSPMNLSVRKKTTPQSLPQLHFFGEDDRVIPPALGEAFLMYSKSKCQKSQTLPNVSHGENWEKHWIDLLKIPLPCLTEKH